MALLFQNNIKEAVCFKTAGSESYLKWTCDSSNGGVIGIGGSNRSMYLGHIEKNTGIIEKVLNIDHDVLRVTRTEGVSRPKQAPVLEPLWVVEDRWGTLNCEDIRPVVVLQDAFRIFNDGSLVQTKATNFQESVAVHAPFSVECEDTRFICASNEIALHAKRMLLHVPEWNHDGNAQIHGGLRVTEKIQCLSHLETVSISADEIVCDANFCASNARLASLSVNDDLCIKGDNRISLANNSAVFTPDTVLIEPSVELKKDLCLTGEAAELRMGAGLSLKATGDIESNGSLTLAKVDTRHSVRGAVDIYGTTRMMGETRIENRCFVTHDCVIGQQHRLANLCVYGTTHLSQPFYSHDRAYFDRSVFFQGDIKIGSGATTVDKQLTLQKGALEISEGTLWVNRSAAPPESKVALGVSGNSHLQGSLTVEGGLTAQSANLSGATVLSGYTECRSNMSVQGDLKTDGKITVSNAIRIHPNEGIQIEKGLPLVLQHGSLTVGGATLSDTIQIQSGAVIDSGGLFVRQGGSPDGSTNGAPLRLRNRRYGLYEPISLSTRWFQFMYVPYGRGGCTHFYLRLQGQCFTPISTKTIDVEFGGCARAPTTKRVVVRGQLIADDGSSADAFVKLWIFQHATTHDYYGFIELQRRISVGFEFQIECPAYRDVFQWKAYGENAPTVTNPEYIPWWKPLDYPDEHHSDTRVSWMTRTGIGETQPLYALDVRPDARFQSKLYHPFNRTLADALGVPVVAHGDKTYVAVGDALEALTKKVFGNP
jgi:cytoskeletal protein CcmA (bactofilin family)